MEEDDCDYRTPIGQVIKHINTICKKPKIDNQLSEALNLFNERLNHHEKYLVSGIFKINFAEAALFLQSSTNLYAKKIDLLWEELLEFHTRLITYEYEHQMETGREATTQDEIATLEERRNRSRRRKNFKLLLSRTDRQKFYKYLFNKRLPPKPVIPVNYREIIDIWREYEWKSKKLRQVPLITAKHMLQYYRLTNYHVLEAEDYEIIDPDEEEYNTLYSRVPGYHHVEHLFDYNDNGMLPDTNYIISKLRLTAYGRMNFLRRRNIPLDTPFEEYKDQYTIYRNEFFEHESKKWQNMPLDTLEDLHKQLQYLLQKEKEANGGIGTDCGSPSNDNDGLRIEILDSSDDDSLFELSFNCDTEFMKSALFVRLEKLSSDIIDTKLRQDSGFFDFNSDSECGDDNAAAVNVNADANNTLVDMETNVNDTVVNTVTADNILGTNDNVNNTEISSDNCCTMINDTGDVTGVNDNFDTRSIISDHDYCVNVPNVNDDTNCLEETANQVDVNRNTIENGSVTNDAKKVNDETVIETFKRPCDPPRVIAKVIAIKEKKEKRKLNNESGDSELPTKRRKLSQKQIEKLLKSKIKPVNQLKFEKFFSLNYQPEIGEGEILEVDYISGESDVEDDEPIPLQNPPNDSHAVSADNDDTRSIHSDHNYCQPAEDLHNDSGFFGASCSQLSVGDTTQAELNENISSDNNAGNEMAGSVEDEFQRLLNSLRDPGVHLIPERQPEELTEEQKQRLESRARVQEWRDTINPILKDLKECDFDIHKYGSQIIDGMEVNETKPFRNIVQGKTSAEVVRFFISSLQLANTNNVDIYGAKAGELSNDTFELKLLSKDRHHEHLQEFLAPSVESLQEKLEKVRALKNSDVTQAKSAERQGNASTQTDISSKRKRISHDFTSNKKRNITVTPSTSTNKITYKKIVKKPETVYKVKECRVVIKSIAQENCNAKSSKGKLHNALKGKNIIKKQPLVDRSQKPLTLDSDISLPSTSYVLWSSSSNYTDSDREHSPVYSPRPPSLDGSQSSASNVRIPSTSYGSASPNKRRRESTEESFRDRFIAAQEMNPYIQLQSTPHGPSR